MPQLFPPHTTEFHLEEPAAFRRFSRSLWEMALVTGVLLRLYRLLVLSHGANSWLYLGGAVALGLTVLVGMATAHLANYPLHQWIWRAPAFAGIEVLAEMVTSVLLISVGREANESVRAHFSDLPLLATRALLLRGLTIILWSALLAGLVKVVRNRFVTEEPEAPEA